MLEQLLTTEEVATKLRLAPATLVIWRTRGTGPEFLKIGHKVAYREADVAAWLAQRQRRNTVAA